MLDETIEESAVETSQRAGKQCSLEASQKRQESFSTPPFLWEGLLIITDPIMSGIPTTFGQHKKE